MTAPAAQTALRALGEREPIPDGRNPIPDGREPIPPPGAPPEGVPFHSALETEWARTAIAEGQQQSHSESPFPAASPTSAHGAGSAKPGASSTPTSAHGAGEVGAGASSVSPPPALRAPPSPVPPPARLRLPPRASPSAFLARRSRARQGTAPLAPRPPQGWRGRPPTPGARSPAPPRARPRPAARCRPWVAARSHQPATPQPRVHTSRAVALPPLPATTAPRATGAQRHPVGLPRATARRKGGRAPISDRRVPTPDRRVPPPDRRVLDPGRWVPMPPRHPRNS